MKFHLYAPIGLVILLQHIGAGEYQCGKLNEKQLNDERAVTDIDEFPWIARIYYRERSTSLHAFRCLGVLIGRRHLLTPVHCIGDRKQFVLAYQPEYVILGDSDYSNLNSEQDCNSREKCTLRPKKYFISDIIYHPNFDRRNRHNDIAIIHLLDDVEFSTYIQPICMPPSSFYTTDVLGQYFAITGYVDPTMLIEYSPTQSKKLKSVAHVVSNTQCSKSFLREANLIPLIDSTVICTSFVGEYVFLSGSILMGVEIVNSKLTNYYLIGILSYGGSSSFGVETIQYNVFTKISSHINWIQHNINQSYKKFQNATVWN